MATEELLWEQYHLVIDDKYTLFLQQNIPNSNRQHHTQN